MKKLLFFLLISICSLKSFSQLRDTIIVDPSQLDSSIVNNQKYYSLKLGMTPVQITQLNTVTSDSKQLTASLASLQATVSNIPGAVDPIPTDVNANYTLTRANDKTALSINGGYTVSLPPMKAGTWCFAYRKTTATPKFVGTGGVVISGGTTINSVNGMVIIYYKTPTLVLINVR